MNVDASEQSHCWNDVEDRIDGLNVFAGALMLPFVLVDYSPDVVVIKVLQSALIQGVERVLLDFLLNKAKFNSKERKTKQNLFIG